jgi:hypothetical protein
MEEIVVEIKRDLTCTIKVAGVAGSECKALTAPLERALEQARTELTPEYHRQPATPRTAVR